MQGWLNLDGRAYCKWRETTNVRDWQALSCFKGVKNVPCCYWVQPKSWLSSELFEGWFKEIDWNFGAQKRKIALTIDNCPAHPYVPVLDWVELIFLSLNKTSITQPIWIKESSELLKQNIVCLQLKSRFPLALISRRP